MRPTDDLNKMAEYSTVHKSNRGRHGRTVQEPAAQVNNVARLVQRNRAIDPTAYQLLLGIIVRGFDRTRITDRIHKPPATASV